MINKTKMLTLSVLLSVGLCCGVAVAGPLKTHSMFSSNMVIQRDKPIIVWGWAEPGQNVSVQFGEETVEATAEAEKGRWEVTFPARPATATGQKLIVSSGDKTVAMDNIVIGDVWVMNGQSNMALELRKALDSDIEIATSDLPLLRQVRINPNESATLQEDIPSSEAPPQTDECIRCLGWRSFAFLVAGCWFLVCCIAPCGGSLW